MSTTYTDTYCTQCGGTLPRQPLKYADWSTGPERYCSQSCVDSYRDENELLRHGVWNRSERRLLIAKVYARAHNIAGARGGWIYQDHAPRGRSGHTATALCQGWDSFERMYRGQIRDWLAERNTASRTFAELINLSPNYRPTIMLSGPGGWQRAALADYYDEAQRERRDPRRAYRGNAARVSHRVLRSA